MFFFDTKNYSRFKIFNIIFSKGFKTIPQYESKESNLLGIYRKLIRKKFER